MNIKVTMTANGVKWRAYAKDIRGKTKYLGQFRTHKDALNEAMSLERCEGLLYEQVRAVKATRWAKL